MTAAAKILQAVRVTTVAGFGIIAVLAGAGISDGNVTAPTLVITAHDGTISGNVVIQAGQGAHFEVPSRSSIGAGDWYQARVEWSVDDPGANYTTARGFNFSHYFGVPGTYTVACRVINVGGGVDFATRTVVVRASTRVTVNVASTDDLATVWAANKGNNREFVIANGATLSRAISGDYSNVVFRSSVPGTRADLLWTGPARVNVFGNPSLSNWTWKDLRVRQGGANRANVIFYPGKTATPTTNFCVVNCEVEPGVAAGSLNCGRDPRGVLIQDCTTGHAVGEDGNIWSGNTPGQSRMFCLYGGVHTNAGLERVLRGNGDYVSVYLATLHQTAAAKEPLSNAGHDFLYVFQSRLICANKSVLLIGHTSGTTQVDQSVFDSNYFESTAATAGSINIGPKTSVAAKVMFRNNIQKNVRWQIGTMKDGRFHHNTQLFTVQPGSGFFQQNAPASSGIVISGNLCQSTVAPDQSFLFRADMAREVLAVNNNVTSGAISEDVQGFERAGGIFTEEYGTFNRRPNANGNLTRTVPIDSLSFRPSNGDDVGLVCAVHPDMLPFLEDYYGHSRKASAAVKGAVESQKSVR